LAGDVSRSLTLLLVRHGETAWNAEGRWQGQRDIPLSDAGRAQSAALGRRLAERPRPDRCYVSDLSRAIETAQLLACGDFAVLPTLRERSFGAWEGLMRAEVRERFGAATHPDDGEAWSSVWERMQDALQAIWDDTAVFGDAATALVVGHGGSLKVLVALALGSDSDAVNRFAFGNASLSIIVFQGPTLEEATGRVLCLNDTSHWSP
jgi:broad specificity phosphatase PhoE